MGAIGYLYRRIFCNRVKTALRRPITYVYILLVLFYFTALPMSLRMVVEEMEADTPEGMITVLTVLAFWVIPANLIAYAKRKGLLYRNSDVHFLFPAPVSPRKVLLYAHLKTLVGQILLNSFAIVCGALLFRVEAWRLAVYFLFSMILENLLEGSIMILIYGSERMGEKQGSLVVKAAYGLVGILVLMGIWTWLREGLSMKTVADYLHSEMVQMVPLIGWYIAALHLIFTGATAVNIAGTCCYLALLILAVTAARRIKCEGSFYEDAMKFAGDYEEVVRSRKQGDSQKRLGKRQKFGKASVNWKGDGARALFYRQLLEYKKSRYFIFDMGTVTALLGGIGIAWFYSREGGFGSMNAFTPFIIPAVSSYLIFVFTAVNGKWAKELRSPYTYMIPDTAFRKLLNATAMHHVQSIVSGCLMTIPGAIAMEMTPVTTVLCIVFYTALSANKLYALAVAEAVCGNTLGTMGKQFLQMLIQGTAIGMAILGGILGMAVGGVLTAYLLMDFFLVMYTLIFMVTAALNFYNMEVA